MTRKAVWIATKLAAASVLFVVLFRPQAFGLSPDTFGGVTPAGMVRHLKETNLTRLLPWLLLATAVKFAGIAAGVARWRVVLSGQDIEVPFPRLLESWLVGRFVGLLLPSALGFDAYRLYDSARHTGRLVESATAVIVEKTIGFLALGVLAFLTFPLAIGLLHLEPHVLLGAWVILGGAVAVALTALLAPRLLFRLARLLPAPRAVRRPLARLGAAVAVYEDKRSLLATAGLLGLLVHLSTIAAFLCAMMGVCDDQTVLPNVSAALPVMVYGAMLGPSPSGEGAREIMFVTLLGTAGRETAAALFAHLAWWTGVFVPSMIGAVLFLLRSRSYREPLRLRTRAVEYPAE